MHASIDRIEGTIAVLIFHNDEPLQVNVPLSILPPGCREGDILRIEIDRDPAATEAVKERVAGRIEKLKNGNF
jgi:hypothetical protein